MRTRKNPVFFMLNDKEYSHLIKQSKISGLSRSVFLRKLILGVEIKERPPGNWSELLRELSAIGNNINQIAKLGNTTGEIKQSDIETIKTMQSEIWGKVKNL